MLTINNRKRKYTDPSAAQHYHDHNGLQVDHVKLFVESKRRFFKKDANVFDIGSGDGKASDYVANTFACRFVTGVDISADRVNFSRQTYRGNTWFFKRDAADLKANASPEIYDVVTSFNALHHLPSSDHPQLFQQMNIILKPTGQAFLLIAGRSPKLHDTIDTTAANETWREYFINFVNPREYRDEQYYSSLAAQAGFEIISAVNEPVEYVFPSTQATLDFICGWSPHIAFLKQNHPNKLPLFLADLGKNISENMSHAPSGIMIILNQNKLHLRKPAAALPLLNSGAPAMNTRSLAP